jgi:hypothetical protein
MADVIDLKARSEVTWRDLVDWKIAVVAVVAAILAFATYLMHLGAGAPTIGGVQWWMFAAGFLAIGTAAFVAALRTVFRLR